SSANWAGAELHDLVDIAFPSDTTSDSQNIIVSGPDVILAPSAVTTLGMVLYELATNATKYGALASPAGKGDISWHVDDSDPTRLLTLTWQETGGASPPDGPEDGFGLWFVRRSVAYELHGVAELEFRGEGLTCTLRLPLHRQERMPAPGAMSNAESAE